MNIADRMIRYRAKERINQHELAERCGVSKQTIYSLENGLQEPTKITLAKVELVIGKEQEE